VAGAAASASGIRFSSRIRWKVDEVTVESLKLSWPAVRLRTPLPQEAVTSAPEPTIESVQAVRKSFD
jgi:hypothetical protein